MKKGRMQDAKLFTVSSLERARYFHSKAALPTISALTFMLTLVC
jgi:hypothetical protein